MSGSPDILLQLELAGKNKLVVHCLTQKPGWNYSFSLCTGDRIVDRAWFSPKPEAVYWLADPGDYHIKAVIRSEQQERMVAYSDKISFAGLLSTLELPMEAENKITVFSSVKNVLREIWDNRQRMLRVAVYDRKIENKDSYLGKLWLFLNPFIQIFTFWMVFGIGMRGGRSINGVPYLLYLLTGLIPWFYLNAGIVRGAASVFAKAGTVLKLKYPCSTIPIGSIIVCIFDHLILMCFIFAVFLFYGYRPTFYWLNLLYYEVFGFFFLSGLSLITSTLTMIARDFQKLLVALIRLLFYWTPILWSIDSMPEKVQWIFMVNPCWYVINGVRDSLITQVNFFEHRGEVLFFWGMAALLWVLGCLLQQRFKTHFYDLI